MKKFLDALGALKWPFLSLILILAFNGLFTPGFFHLEIKDGHFYGSLVDVIYRSSPIVLLALGMTLVIATGGVDLSVGSVAAVAGAVAAVKLHSGASVPAALLFAALAALVAGALNGILVARLEIQPIVATLVLMITGRGAAQLLTDGQIIGIDHPVFKWIGGGFIVGLPFAVSVSAIAFIVIYSLCRVTALGLFIESVGSNALAARYAGIATAWVKFSVYLVSAFSPVRPEF